jgi:hypothetical protein
MFDPEDVQAMAAALHTAITSRETLAPLGLQRARLFGWDECADLHMHAYRGLINE